MFILKYYLKTWINNCFMRCVTDQNIPNWFILTYEFLFITIFKTLINSRFLNYIFKRLIIDWLIESEDTQFKFSFFKENSKLKILNICPLTSMITLILKQYLIIHACILTNVLHFLNLIWRNLLLLNTSLFSKFRKFILVFLLKKKFRRYHLYPHNKIRLAPHNMHV